MQQKKRRQKQRTFVMPSVGDTIYLPSMLYLSHGVDDFHGGKCTISRVIPEGNPMDVFIEVAERPGVQCRYRDLLGEQEQLKAEYSDTVGHMQPDYRPEFNNDPY